MEKNGILKRNTETGKLEQIAFDLSYQEALMMVGHWRAKRVGHHYWIGSLS